MNRTIWNQLGGHPLILDDFQHDQGAIREAISKILGGLTSNTPVIIQGVLWALPTTNTITWTSGYVYFQDEFFHVTSGSLVWPGPPSGSHTIRLRGQVNSFFTNIDPMVYASSQQKYVHEVRQCRFVLDPTGTGPDVHDPRNWPTLPNGILARIDSTRLSNHLDLPALLSRLNQADTWHVVGNSTSGLGTTLLNAFSSIAQATVPTIAFRKDSSGWVHLRGITAKNGSTATASHIFTLPVGYIPNNGLTSSHLPTLKFNTWSNFSGLTSALVEIKANGEVHIAGGVITTGVCFILNELSFPTI